MTVSRDQPAVHAGEDRPENSLLINRSLSNRLTTLFYDGSRRKRTEVIPDAVRVRRPVCSGWSQSLMAGVLTRTGTKQSICPATGDVPNSVFMRYYGHPTPVGQQYKPIQTILLSQYASELLAGLKSGCVLTSALSFSTASILRPNIPNPFAYESSKLGSDCFSFTDFS